MRFSKDVNRAKLLLLLLSVLAGSSGSGLGMVVQAGADLFRADAAAAVVTNHHAGGARSSLEAGRRILEKPCADRAA